MLSNSSSSFNASFLVLSSDLACTILGDKADVGFTHTCILPVNDECENAIALGVSINTCSYTSFSTDNATASGYVPAGGGTGFDDLWYSFTAINDTVQLEFDNLPGTFGYYGLYDGCPSSGGNEIASGNVLAFSGPGSILFTGLTTGSNYILQLFHFDNQSGNDQEICLQAAPVPCPQDIIVSDVGSNTPNTSYSACNSISMSVSTTLSSSGVLYEAPAVILNPGFHSGSGVFEAKATN